jgi:hypothetical protein
MPLVPPSDVTHTFNPRVNRALAAYLHTTPPQRGKLAGRERMAGQGLCAAGQCGHPMPAVAISMLLSGGTAPPHAAANELITTHCYTTTLPGSLYPPTRATTNPSTALPDADTDADTLFPSPPFPHRIKQTARQCQRDNTTHKPTEPRPLYSIERHADHPSPRFAVSHPCTIPPS